MAMEVYTVTKKPLAPNTVWDTETGKPLCRFVKGKLVTNDEQTAERLGEMGHKVEKADDGSGVDEPKKDAGDGAGKVDAGDGELKSADGGAETGAGDPQKSAGNKSRK